jgi:hypothetical protein
MATTGKGLCPALDCDGLMMMMMIYIQTTDALRDDRFSVVRCILAYYARGRWFESRTVQTFECMNTLFTLDLSVFYV